MKAQELREKFIKFFEKRGHKRLPSASLVPENDPSALFINSGMHPLVPYLLGQPHPEGKRLVSVQKCLRTDDIDEVGDSFHHTFFEMLGNWSLGDYFKEDAIKMAWEFVTKELKIPKKRLSVSCFIGDKDAPRDEEAAKIWQSQGIPKERIYFFGKKENWWAVGRTGPCGPDTEIFYDTGKKACGPKCQPGCPCGKYFEIWNLVFMVYNRQQDGSLQKLKQKNVDTGMGLERTLAALQGKEDDYETELFAPIIKEIEEASEEKYEGENKILMRIIADHLRAAVFLIADGLLPSNKDRGYILRRLIRRSVRFGRDLNIKTNFLKETAFSVIEKYGEDYPEIKENKENVLEILDLEEKIFRKTLERGIKALKKIFNRAIGGVDPENLPAGMVEDNIIRVDGREVFRIYETYGVPPEVSQEIMKGWGLAFDNQTMEKCREAMRRHQKESRISSKGKFKGGLSSRDPQVVKLHTTTHLLHAALRKVLGEHVQQVGSNITQERLRFDFTHPDKLNARQIKEVEGLVNEKIKKNLKIECEDMTLDEAKKKGALAFFGQRYPEKVRVYSIKGFCCEVCAGPHVDFTGKLGRFIIKKEESSGAGKRRIYAMLEA